MNLKPTRILLAVFDRSTTGGPWLDGLADSPRVLQATLDAAFANGLYYPFVRRLLENRMHLPATEETRWQEQRGGAARYRATLALLRSVSEESGIPYTVIKNATTVEQVPRDVDVFLGETDRRDFLTDLTRRKLRLLYDDESEISLEGDGLLRIDVYSRIRYLHRDFLEAAYLGTSRTEGRAFGVRFPTLNADATYLLNSAHSIFGHAAITLLDYVDLRALSGRAGGADRRRAVADASGWGRVLGLWEERLAAIQRRLDEDGRVGFPLRHGRRFILQCAEALAGPPLAGADRRAFRRSLLWDDLLYLAEGAGLDKLVRRSRIATGVANTAGHRLRSLRGDRKRADVPP